MLRKKKKDVSREEVSEKETRDWATIYELGGHFQGEKTENPGSSILYFLCFLALVFLGYSVSFSTEP